MANFLELAQMTARWSGTVSGTHPLSVLGQTGRLGRMVDFTSRAWLDIQQQYNHWSFMRDDYTAETIVGLAEHTAASFNINNFDHFLVYDNTPLYLSENDGSQLFELVQEDHQTVRKMLLQNPNETGRPRRFAYRERDGALVFYPRPDAAYKVYGTYKIEPQTLSVDADIPRMPAKYHRLIPMRALITQHRLDEAQLPAAFSLDDYQDLLALLVRDQLPRVTVQHGGADL